MGLKPRPQKLRTSPALRRINPSPEDFIDALSTHNLYISVILVIRPMRKNQLEIKNQSFSLFPFPFSLYSIEVYWTYARGLLYSDHEFFCNKR